MDITETIKIVGPRSSGLSTELIKKAAETGGLLVVHSQPAIIDIVEYANRLGLKIKKPITYYDLIHKQIERTGKKNTLLIDNLDLFIAYFVKTKKSFDNLIISMNISVNTTILNKNDNT